MEIEIFLLTRKNCITLQILYGEKNLSHRRGSKETELLNLKKHGFPANDPVKPVLRSGVGRSNKLGKTSIFRGWVKSQTVRLLQSRLLWF